MKLKSFNYFIGLLIIFSYSHLLSEEKIDIWKNKKETITNSSKLENSDTQKRSNLQTSQTIKALEKIQVQEGLTTQLNEQKVYGIYEPSNYDFNLNMWSTTKAEDLRSSLKRLNKIELSTSSNEFLRKYSEDGIHLSSLDIQSLFESQNILLESI